MRLRLKNAVQWVQERFAARPKLGIILGTGSGSVAAEIVPELMTEYAKIPGLPKTTALGHQGKLVCGLLHGCTVVAMNGRHHLYEGHSPNAAAAGVFLMQQLGIDTLVVTNASGGLNPNFVSGDVMVMESHIDLMFRPLSRSPASDDSVQNQRSSCNFYDPKLQDTAIKCGRNHDFVLQRGVYAALLGPNYETRAEYRLLRLLGADVVGMSTVPEVKAASYLNLRTLGLSVITNIAKPDFLSATSGHEVITAAETAASKIALIVKSVAEQAP